MQLIVISSPCFLKVESEAIRCLFDEGLQTFHLRKPDATPSSIQRLLETIPEKYHSGIVLHDAFSLITMYPVKGIHLNRRNPVVPDGFSGTVSCSCHSTEEVKRCKERFDYVFLSPIFDSISKKGYRSCFSATDLSHARETGIIDKKVVALGGMDEHTLPLIRAFGFGGAAVLGTLWNQFEISSDSESILSRYRKLTRILGNL